MKRKPLLVGLFAGVALVLLLGAVSGFRDLWVKDSFVYGEDVTEDLTIDWKTAYTNDPVFGYDTTSDGLYAYTGFTSGAFTVDNTGGTRAEHTKYDFECVGAATSTCTFDSFLIMNETINMVGAFTANDGSFNGDVAFGAAGSAAFNGTMTGAYTSVPIVFPSYLEENTRFVNHRFHGNFVNLTSGQALDSSPTNITVTAGIGKLYVVLNTCSDAIGSITVTGTSVNRDTKAETGADTDTLSALLVSTDSTATDAQSNNVWAITDGYMTAKWFKGSVTLSTSDMTCTDVDVYQIAFEQVNDHPDLTFTTYDATVDITNTGGWVYAYVYLVEYEGQPDQFSVTNYASLVIDPPVANKTYRLRHGAIGQAFDGTTDGFWSEVHFGGSPTSYIDNYNQKIWVTQDIDIKGAAE